MSSPLIPTCDGCGQEASSEHIAGRLKRLEWATRYRPVHIQTLFLGTASPETDEEFLYSLRDEFQGEAAALLEAAGVSRTGKSRDAVLMEFQRRGCFLAYVLECPLEQSTNSGHGISNLLTQRTAAVATRIRRSLKPKRVTLLGSRMETLAQKWLSGELGCPLLLNNGRPYDLEGAAGQHDIVQLRAALETPLSAP